MNINTNSFGPTQDKTGSFYLNKLNMNFTRTFNNKTVFIFYILGICFYIGCLYFLRDELKIISQFKLLKEIFSKIPFYILLLGYFGMTGFTLVYFGILKYFTNAILYLQIGFLILTSLASLKACLIGGDLSIFYGFFTFLLSLIVTAYAIYLFIKYKRIIITITKASTKEAFNNINKYILALIIPFIIILIQFWICFLITIFYIEKIEKGNYEISELLAFFFIDFFFIWTTFFFMYLFKAYVTSTILIDLYNNSKSNENGNEKIVNVNSYAWYFTLMSSGSMCFLSLLFALIHLARTLIHFAEQKISNKSKKSNNNSYDSKKSTDSVVSDVLSFIILIILKIFTTFLDQSLKLITQYAIPDMMTTGNNLVDSVKNSFQVVIGACEHGFAVRWFVNMIQNSFVTYLFISSIFIGGIMSSFTKGLFFDHDKFLVLNEIIGFILILPGFIFAYFLGTIYDHCVSTLIYSSYVLSGDLSKSYPDLMDLIYNFNNENLQHYNSNNGNSQHNNLSNQEPIVHQ